MNATEEVTYPALTLQRRVNSEGETAVKIDAPSLGVSVSVYKEHRLVPADGGDVRLQWTPARISTSSHSMDVTAAHALLGALARACSEALMLDADFPVGTEASGHR